MKRLLTALAVICSFLACEKAPEEIHVVSVSLSQPTAEMVVGESVQLNATINPSDATEKTITWSSSNPSVATVSGGKVTAVAEGTTNITASAGGKSATCAITVKKKTVDITSVELNKTELALTEGESETLVATVKPDDATDKTVTWSSSNIEVATVDNAGKVIGISKGNAIIVAKAGDKEAKCVVSVNAKSLSILYKTSDGSLAQLKHTEGIKSHQKDPESGWNIIVLNEGVTSFSDWFRENTSIIEVVIPQGISSLAIQAFYMCTEISSVILPDGLVEIGGRAFGECRKLSVLELPESLQVIGYYAFNNCRSLRSIVIPDSVTSYGEAFISVCPNLESINGLREFIRDGVLYAIAPAGLTSYIVPDGVNTIGVSAFGAYENLTEVTLPNGLQTIEANAFWYSGIKGIIIPDTVESIGEQAFLYCEELKTIHLPENLKSLEWRTFMHCSKLESIHVPNNVTTIANNTFVECYSLKDITLGSGVTRIDGFAFGYCNSLVAINLHSVNPPMINENTFGEATINYIFVPEGSVQAYKEADIWSNYSSIIKALPPAGNVVFTDGHVRLDCINLFDKDGDGEVSYYELALATEQDLYKLGRHEYESFDEFQYFTGIVSVPNSLFEGCVLMTSIILPESIRELGEYSFKGCSKLAGLIVLPDGIKRISRGLFDGCANLSGISIPESVTYIGWYAFNGCANLTDINIPGKVTWIEGFSFQDCSSLTCISIPEGITNVGIYTFSGCASLINVSLPKSLNLIDGSAFRGCSNLADIVIPNGVETINSSAFEGCTHLKSITIPEGVTAIASYTFYGCESLTRVSIPTGVSIIGESSFRECFSLKKITIPQGVTSIKDLAFFECRELSEIIMLDTTPPNGSNGMFRSTNNCPIYVPAESVTAYRSAQYWSEYADRIQADPAVDLGLSVKWATCNLGASKPEEYGDYYAWGETKPYYKPGHSQDNPCSNWEDGKAAGYDWPSYKWCGESYNIVTKYNTSSDYGVVDNKYVLETGHNGDDVASAKIGGTWRMPTDEEWSELRNNCTWTVTTQNGVMGRLVTSNINGKSIFLPNAGCRSDLQLIDPGYTGYYWSSSLDTGKPISAWSVFLGFNNDVYRNSNGRWGGCSVRPVIEK